MNHKINMIKFQLSLINSCAIYIYTHLNLESDFLELLYMRLSQQ